MWFKCKEETPTPTPTKPEFSIVGGEATIKPIYSVYGVTKTGVFSKKWGIWIWTPVARDIQSIYVDYFQEYQSEHLELIASKLRELNGEKS